MSIRSQRRVAELKVIEAAQRWNKNKFQQHLMEMIAAIDALDALDLAAPKRTRTVNHAPQTSHDAAASMEARAGSDAYRVMQVIRAAWLRGSTGLTDDQLEQELGMRHQSVSARRNQLRDEGWIFDSGLRRYTRSGREAIVWTPTNAGTYQLIPEE